MDPNRHSEWGPSVRSRRQVLSTLGAALAGVSAGCSDVVEDLEQGETDANAGPDSESTDGPSDADETVEYPDHWSMYRYDGPNTGYHRNAPGPSGGLAKNWEAEVEHDVRTPVVSGSAVYVLSAGPGILYAFDRESGEKLWTVDDNRMGYPQEAVSMQHRTYNRTTPAVANGHVYVSAETAGQSQLFWGILAIDAESGDVEWEFETNLVPSSPVVADGTIYTGSGKIYAIEPDGSEKWTIDEVTLQYPPTIVDGKTYWGVDAEDAVYPYVVCADAENGQRRWKTQMNIGGGSPVVDGRIFGAGKTGPIAYEAVEGGEKLWNERELTDIAPWAPTYSHGNLYVHQRRDYTGDGNHNRLFAYDPATGDRRWHHEARIDDRPVTAGDSLYLYDSSRGVVCLDPSDGTERWAYGLEADLPPNSSVTVDGTDIFVTIATEKGSPDTLVALEES